MTMEITDTYKKNGNLTKLIEILKEWIKKFPEDKLTHLELAELLEQNNQFKEALDINVKCLGMGFNDGYMYEIDNRIIRLKKYILYSTMSRREIQLNYKVGDVYSGFIKDEGSTLLDIYKELVEINPNDVLYCYKLAYFLKKDKQYKEALIIYKKCLEMKFDKKYIEPIGYKDEIRNKIKELEEKIKKQINNN